ncbi:MAG: SDR family oxidoreductase, partial [Gemmataceae bacterium]
MTKASPKTIVLTGATRGLGRAMVEKFVGLGHRVAGCGRGEAHIEQLNKKFGSSCRFSVVNVTDPKAVRTWSAEVVQSLGVPDLLLNNAAVINRNAPLWEIEAEEFDRLIDINIKGVANVVRAFLPGMIDRGSGVVVNFSSGWGRSTS